MNTQHKPTYISLFSSAGVGCYGFKMAGFDCIATNELLERRLNIQRYNQKCKYPGGYICGDITQEQTQKLLYDQLELWKAKEHLSRVDVVIATPPCQGMSIANQKKNDTEIVRNSLVVESIKIIQKINPRFFVFENVPAFMKTICTDLDGTNKSIADAIERNLGQEYSYAARIINFKNYGACSSRQRTVVIGVSKDYADSISPLELYPDLLPERTLREVIGDMKPLKEFGEIDPTDIYHAFRIYPEHMRAWIADLKEGQSAFENPDDNKKPHQIINGEIVINKQKNHDKYKRQYWDKVGPCIHTRNDLLASQNTIHPSDDRVFSIREIMRMMTVPESFRWVDRDPDTLNQLPEKEKRAFLKKEETKIRQSLGEAVPTAIFHSIAEKIADALAHPPLPTLEINKIIAANHLSDAEALKEFLTENPLDLSFSTLSRIAELSNTNRTETAAFFTSKTLITEMMKTLPVSEQETIRILEPSVGVGNFIPFILKKFEGKNLQLDIVDIDSASLELAKILLQKYHVPDTCTIRYINDDFLLHDFPDRYDYVIGNPPFFKLKASDPRLPLYRLEAKNKNTSNICSFFLEKSLRLAKYVALVFPKFLLNTPEFSTTRAELAQKSVDAILDFGEKGFPGILVETIAIFVNNLAAPANTNVFSLTHRLHLTQPQAYIFDPELPYWIIYRNQLFDSVCQKLDFDVFEVFRDRQLTNKLLSSSGELRVLKSRNLSDDGKEILDIPGYDSYISYAAAKPLSVFQYLDVPNVYLTPNMTYKPRMMKKPPHCVVNGSLAILIPKGGIVPTEKQLAYFSSEEYRAFYQIARNFQTRSLNVDACSVFFYGLLRDEAKPAPEKFDTSVQLSFL